MRDGDRRMDVASSDQIATTNMLLSVASYEIIRSWMSIIGIDCSVEYLNVGAR